MFFTVILLEWWCWRDAGKNAGVDVRGDAGGYSGGDANGYAVGDPGGNAGVDAGGYGVVNAGVDDGGDAGRNAGIDTSGDAVVNADVDTGGDAGGNAGIDAVEMLLEMGDAGGCPDSKSDRISQQEARTKQKFKNCDANSNFKVI